MSMEPLISIRSTFGLSQNVEHNSRRGVQTFREVLELVEAILLEAGNNAYMANKLFLT